MKRFLSIFLLLTFLTSTVSAANTFSISKAPFIEPGATYRLSSGQCSVNYNVTMLNGSTNTFQFHDLSKGNETYIRWDFGDGTCLVGTKITPALKNPTHKFPVKAWDTHYTGCLTIRCTGVKGSLWVHRDLKILVPKKPCQCPK